MNNDTISQPPVTPPPALGDVEPAIATPPTPSGEPLKGGRLKKSWLLLKCSFAALKKDKSLVGVQLSGILIACLVIIIAAVVGILYFMFVSAIPGTVTGQGDDTSLAWYAYLPFVFIATIALATASTYAAVALAYGALRVFAGENVTVMECLGAATKRFGSIMSFGLITGTVGFILRVLEDRFGSLFATIAIRLVGAVWSVATMFVPALIANSTGKMSGIEATKQSAAIIKKTWGESLILTVSVGLAGSLVVVGYVLASMAVAVGVAFLNTAAAGGIAIIALIGFFVAILLLSTLSAIVNAALYYYATYNQAPQGFSPEILQSVLSQKKRKGLFGRAKANQ